MEHILFGRVLRSETGQKIAGTTEKIDEPIAFGIKTCGCRESNPGYRLGKPVS
jgi:hypothetical protein